MKNYQDGSIRQSDQFHTNESHRENKSQNASKQPNSRHCFVCGVENEIGLHLEFFQTTSGEVFVDTMIPEQYQGYPGVVHGGIVASLVDEVLGRVHMGGNPEIPRFMYTAKLTVQYRKPVPTNQPLKIIGEAIKSKNRSATSRAKILGPEGDVLVEANALLINVPEGVVDSVGLEALGWQVYPDQE
jgi:acyl-coenzyme A thioesterase PaaI-like protein